MAGDERPKGSQNCALFPIPRKAANNSHFLEKPPRSRGKRSGATFTGTPAGKPPHSRGKPSQPNLNYHTPHASRFNPSDSATPHIHRRHQRNRKYPAPRSSDLDQTVWKRLCPSTHRSAIRGINSRSRARFPRQPRDFTSATKKRPQSLKGQEESCLFLLQQHERCPQQRVTFEPAPRP